MGFLSELWDETLAGPAPAESDVGKLRRYESGPAVVPGEVIVSRSITVVRSNSGPGGLSVDPGLDSPRTPATPGTPSEGFTRRKLAGGEGRAEPRNPTVYDWIVISALDR